MTFSWTYLFVRLCNYYDSYWTISLQFINWILLLPGIIGHSAIDFNRSRTRPPKRALVVHNSKLWCELTLVYWQQLVSFFNLESLNWPNQPVCFVWWFCISECNFLWLNRKCFLPQLTYNKTGKQLLNKGTNANLPCCESSSSCARNLWWRRKHGWREVWWRGNSPWKWRVQEELTHSTSLPGLWLRWKQKEFKRLLSPMPSAPGKWQLHRCVLLKPVWFNATGLHQPGMDKWRLVKTLLLLEVRFRSFIGSRWGVPTQFSGIALGSALTCFALLRLLSSLN